MRCRRARPTPASPIPPLATPTDSLPPPTATVSVVPVETALPVSLSATPPRAPIPFARDSPNHHQRLQHRPLHSTRIHMLTRGGINMCVCTRGYQTSHARAITNVGRSQLHRFIAVTADLRVAVIKTKKKKKGKKEGEKRTDRNNGSRLPKGWWLPSPKWKTRYVMGFSTRNLCYLVFASKDSFPLRSLKISFLQFVSSVFIEI